jgi:hypothetical protein
MASETYVVSRDGNDVKALVYANGEVRGREIWSGTARGYNRTHLSEYLGLKADGRSSQGAHDRSWVTVNKDTCGRSEIGGHAEHKWYVEARIPKPEYP